MRTNEILKALPLLVGGALVVAMSGACDQPRTACVTGRGDFAAKYNLVSGTGACAALKGEVIGVQSYNANAGDHPDLEKSSMAIRPSSLGELVVRGEGDGLVDPNTEHKPFSYGPFTTSEPGDDNFCAAPTLSVTEQNLPVLPAIPADPKDPESTETPEQPATSRKYEWSNVHVYVTAAATGTQFAADLTYTEDGCSAKYHVLAVYPAATCKGKDGKPEIKLCGAEADLSVGMETGSGLSPDFAITCDPELFLCVLSKEPPSLR